MAATASERAQTWVDDPDLEDRDMYRALRCIYQQVALPKEVSGKPDRKAMARQLAKVVISKDQIMCAASGRDPFPRKEKRF